MVQWQPNQVVTIKIPALYATAGSDAGITFVSRQRIGDIHKHFAVVHEDIIDAYYLYHLPSGYRLGMGCSELEAHTDVACLYALPVDWSEVMPLLGIDAETLEEIRDLVGLKQFEGCLSKGRGGLSALGGPDADYKLPSDFILEEIEADKQRSTVSGKRRLKRLAE